MPMYEFQCRDCGRRFEILVVSSDDEPTCPECGKGDLQKLLSAHSSYSGEQSGGLPGAGDTGCCGSSPGHAGCAGPGSCCGKA